MFSGVLITKMQKKKIFTVDFWALEASEGYFELFQYLNFRSSRLYARDIIDPIFRFYRFSATKRYIGSPDLAIAMLRTGQNKKVKKSSKF